mgnify:CR=1 FL=1
MGTDQAIEQEIQAKGLTAPRVTPAGIEANIASEHYFTGADANALLARDPRFLGYAERTGLLSHPSFVLRMAELGRAARVKGQLGKVS